MGINLVQEKKGEGGRPFSLITPLIDQLAKKLMLRDININLANL
jgi:hypothetical protein